MRLWMVMLMVGVVGCKKQTPPDDVSTHQAATSDVLTSDKTDGDANDNGGDNDVYAQGGDSGNGGDAYARVTNVEQAIDMMERNFRRVNFATDSSKLTGDAISALSDNAALMQRFTSISVEIEGHADERGTVDYNLALGQRRASIIRAQLAQMGVGPSRLRIISYGEERPAVSGSDEGAWSQNRRAEFRVMSSDAPVSGTVQ